MPSLDYPPDVERIELLAWIATTGCLVTHWQDPDGRYHTRCESPWHLTHTTDTDQMDCIVSAASIAWTRTQEAP